jgi:hypothetical protein
MSALPTNRILHGDCVHVMRELPSLRIEGSTLPPRVGLLVVRRGGAHGPRIRRLLDANRRDPCFSLLIL